MKKLEESKKRSNTHLVRLNAKEEAKKDTALELYAKNSVSELYRMYQDKDKQLK